VTRPRPHHAGRFDRHWLNTLAFTLSLVGLVTLAMGANLAFAATTLATCAVGFGFFYLLFATGAYFGLVMANGLAVYVSLFAFFREANFAAASDAAALVAFALPVLAFLAGCFANRAAIGRALAARHDEVPRHLPPMVRWMPVSLVVGAASFALREWGLSAPEQGHALMASMAVIALFVGIAARDLVVLLIDVATVFENVAERANRLMMPMVAFLTYYALVTLVFACLYRVVEMVTAHGQFRVHGEVRALSFAEALYFSVITMATVGYGDIVPEGAPVRALSAAEVVVGVLLLLFGFREIMQARDVGARRGRRQGGDHVEMPEAGRPD
jgi:voltage-gated potassium channel